jgi:hypothetical protein
MNYNVRIATLKTGLEKSSQTNNDLNDKKRDMEHEFSDDGRIYIESEDSEDYLIICPTGSDCDSVNIKKILKVIADKDPKLYMNFVTVEMLKMYS